MNPVDGVRSQLMAAPHRSIARFSLVIVGVALITSACGSAPSDNGDAVAATSPTTTMTTEAAPATTVAPVVPASPVVALGEIPAMVEEWGRGEGDPLDLARRIIGFPTDIGVPDGSTPFEVSLDL